MKKPVTMIFSLICMTVLSVFLSGNAEARPPAVVFWNLENFFDCTDGGGGSSDREFSASGERRWTRSRYWKKCHGVAKTLFWIADRYGRLPDVVGVAEVENIGVMRSVVHGTLLRKYDYGIVHRDSPDPRGIDVALVFRKDVFEKIVDRAVPVTEDTEGRPMKTRDILHVCLETKDGRAERYHFLVNHHPSKYGGEQISAKKRSAAMRVLAAVCDSLSAAGEENIICMGDFNDTPDGDAFAVIEGRLENLACPIAEQGRGTIRYAGKWELIDMFLVGGSLGQKMAMEICFPEFLTVRDRAYSGLKPLRTYTGPRYAGGISDHLPIVLVPRETGVIE